MNILFLLLQSLLFYKNEMPKPIRGGSDLSGQSDKKLSKMVLFLEFAHYQN
jgi:hypothetical protein